jgi:hypothetical protein
MSTGNGGGKHIPFHARPKLEFINILKASHHIKMLNVKLFGEIRFMATDSYLQ